MSVKVLGAGAMGSLVAHELAKIGKVAPTLLFKSKQRLDLYLQEGSKITVVRPDSGTMDTSVAKIDGALAPNPERNHERIENLVVSTKTYATVHALSPYVPYLDENSNLLILQNGMGMVDTLKRKFWQDSQNIPAFYEAISSHGAFKLTPNVVNHVGYGKLTIAPAFGNKTALEEPPLMVQALLDCDKLNVSYVSQDEMLLTQMEKLVVNACINPLSALLDCFNGDLMLGVQVVPIMKRVIQEAVGCFRAEFDTQLSAISGSSTVLDPDHLLNTVLEVCKATSQNSSSMREDVRRMQTTEIDSINGYLVGLGKKHSIPTATNKMLVSMIHNKISIERGIEKSALQNLSV